MYKQHLSCSTAETVSSNNTITDSQKDEKYQNCINLCSVDKKIEVGSLNQKSQQLISFTKIYNDSANVPTEANTQFQNQDPTKFVNFQSASITMDHPTNVITSSTNTQEDSFVTRKELNQALGNLRNELVNLIKNGQEQNSNHIKLISQDIKNIYNILSLLTQEKVQNSNHIKNIYTILSQLAHIQVSSLMQIQMTQSQKDDTEKEQNMQKISEQKKEYKQNLQSELQRFKYYTKLIVNNKKVKNYLELFDYMKQQQIKHFNNIYFVINLCAHFYNQKIQNGKAFLYLAMMINKDIKKTPNPNIYIVLPPSNMQIQQQSNLKQLASRIYNSKRKQINLFKSLAFSEILQKLIKHVKFNKSQEKHIKNQIDKIGMGIFLLWQEDVQISQQNILLPSLLYLVITKDLGYPQNQINQKVAALCQYCHQDKKSFQSISAKVFKKYELYQQKFKL